MNSIKNHTNSSWLDRLLDLCWFLLSLSLALTSTSVVARSISALAVLLWLVGFALEIALHLRERRAGKGPQA